MKTRIAEVGILIILMGILFSSKIITFWDGSTDIEKLLFIVSIVSMLLCFLAIILFVPILLGTIGFGVAAGMNNTESNGQRPIIFQVPKNHRWILRNVWQSDPNTREGYEEKNEGWRFYIPKFWQADEGLVSLAPHQLDPNAHTINCIDGNDVEVDVRATYCVRAEEKAAIKYLLNTASGDVDNIIMQRLKVAINQAMDVASNDAIRWGTDKKKEYGVKASIILNELLKNDYGKDYGLDATISVENIEPTPEVKAAADRNTAENFDQESMKKETDAIVDMAARTGANPNIVLLTQMISDIFRAKKKEKKNE